MRTDPVIEKKNIRIVKGQELNNIVMGITRVVAIIVAFVSVFFFFIKILYF